MILVTGASGFIGGHVARLLVERGQPVRVLLRPSSNLIGLAGLPVEKAVGDLREAASLRPALQGCTTLYHVAADYRLWARDPGDLYSSNVAGTRNILEASLQAGVERVVFTSSVGCIGLPGDGRPGTEDAPVALTEMAGDYKRSKFMAEQVALDYADRGLNLVVVNPTAPIGEIDLKPTPTGKIIVDFMRGAMPAYVDTGLNLIDVRDVARGHLLAAERGVLGQRYILGARNMTLLEIFRELSRLTGRRAPRLRMPYGITLAYAGAATALSRFTGREPRAPLEAVRMASKKMFVRTDKAERELGFRAGSVEDALKRAIRWFQENHYF